MMVLCVFVDITNHIAVGNQHSTSNLKIAASADYPNIPFA